MTNKYLDVLRGKRLISVLSVKISWLSVINKDFVKIALDFVNFVTTQFHAKNAAYLHYISIVKS